MKTEGRRGHGFRERLCRWREVDRSYMLDGKPPVVLTSVGLVGGLACWLDLANMLFKGGWLSKFPLNTMGCVAFILRCFRN